jgi:hypothetical protein
MPAKKRYHTGFLLDEAGETSGRDSRHVAATEQRGGTRFAEPRSCTFFVKKLVVFSNIHNFYFFLPPWLTSSVGISVLSYYLPPLFVVCVYFRSIRILNTLCDEPR